MKEPPDTFHNQQCAIAYDEYLEEKRIAVANGRASTVTKKIISKRNGLHENALTNYYANQISRNKT